jgi:hypothetical protein
MQPSCNLIIVTNRREVQKSRKCLTVVNLTPVCFNTLDMIRGQGLNPDVMTLSPGTDISAVNPPMPEACTKYSILML